MAVIVYKPATPPAQPQSTGFLIPQNQIGNVPSSGTLTDVLTPVAFIRPEETGIGYAS
jgi:hypothetical protein